jgi:hypothetical protein
MDCVEAPEKRCLVCGEKRLNRSVECNEQCGGWVHKSCHEAAIGVLEGSKTSERMRKRFKCNDIKWNVKKQAVDRYFSGRSSKAKREKLRSESIVSGKSGIGRKRRYTKISSGYVCEFCHEYVHICDENHEMEFCKAFRSEPIFGAKLAYTPMKRARIVEFTSKKLKLDSFRRNPPESDNTR